MPATWTPWSAEPPPTGRCAWCEAGPIAIETADGETVVSVAFQPGVGLAKRSSDPLTGTEGRCLVGGRRARTTGSAAQGTVPRGDLRRPAPGGSAVAVAGVGRRRFAGDGRRRAEVPVG